MRATAVPNIAAIIPLSQGIVRCGICHQLVLMHERCTSEDEAADCPPRPLIDESPLAAAPSSYTGAIIVHGFGKIWRPSLTASLISSLSLTSSLISSLTVRP